MTVRSKQSAKRINPLGFALLGLLQQTSRSGYALMRLFTMTPMRHFSDSPGAIYPALRRLENCGLIGGAAQPSGAVRRQRAFHITSAGRTALVQWLTAPVTVQDVQTDVGLLMLRFSLHSDAVSVSATRKFLDEFALALDQHLATLLSFYREHAPRLPLPSRLALAGGIEVFKARRRWLESTRRTFRLRRPNTRPHSRSQTR